jgi:hypothetical protein
MATPPAEMLYSPAFGASVRFGACHLLFVFDRVRDSITSSVRATNERLANANRPAFVS